MTTFLIRLTFTAFLLVSAPCSAALMISVEPSPSTFTAGTSVSVALKISGLGIDTAPSLGTFDLDLGFDADILSFSSAVFGDPVLGDQLDFTGLGSLSLTTANSGSINLFSLSFDLADELDSLQADSFTLVTLFFGSSLGPIASDTSPLNLTINSLGDAKGDALSADISNGSLTITGRTNGTVPEPAIWQLLSIAMIVIRFINKSPRAT